MGSMLGFLLAIYKYCIIPVAILNVCILKVRDGLCSFVGLNNMLSDEMSDDDVIKTTRHVGTLIPIPFLLSLAPCSLLLLAPQSSADRRFSTA